jgi:PPOX class probable F420-dependent enzyme
MRNLVRESSYYDARYDKEKLMPEVPPGHADLLDKPAFAHLATVRPDGSPQSSVMWFAWDGSRIRMTHTRTRQKFANLAREPRVALSIADLDDQYRVLEVRGAVEKIEDDPGGDFYRSLQRRYGMDYPILDADVRVIITIRPDRFVAVSNGSVVGQQA